MQTALENQAEVVWHSFEIFDEASKKYKEFTLFKDTGFSDGELLSGLEVFQRLKTSSFSWTWPGLISCERIGGTRFEEGIESEDAIFGMQLFAFCMKIYVKTQTLMFYRIRPNSISQHALTKGKSTNISFPLYQKDLVDSFNGDAYNIRHYSFAYSCAIISLRMDEFIKRERLSEEMTRILVLMIEERAIYAFGGLSFEKDPRNIRGICSKLLDYTSRVRWSSKLAYYFPGVFRILKRLKTMIKG